MLMHVSVASNLLNSFFISGQSSLMALISKETFCFESVQLLDLRFYLLLKAQLLYALLQKVINSNLFYFVSPVNQ
jgi:hypothetical protein